LGILFVKRRVGAAGFPPFCKEACLLPPLARNYVAKRRRRQAAVAQAAETVAEGTILPVPHGGKDLLEVELGPILRVLEAERTPATRILLDATRELVLSPYIAIPASYETFYRDVANNWLYLYTALVERGISYNVEMAKRALAAGDVEAAARHIQVVLDIFDAYAIISVWLTILAVAIAALRLPPEARSDILNNILLKVALMQRRYTAPRIEPELLAPP